MIEQAKTSQLTEAVEPFTKKDDVMADQSDLLDSPEDQRQRVKAEVESLLESLDYNHEAIRDEDVAWCDREDEWRCDALVELGPLAVEALIEATESKSYRVRMEAACALGNIKDARHQTTD